jgi:NADH-quinone oxidoreductase subunit N
MFSLAGFPPTAGFFGKLFVFEAAIRAGYTPLTLLAVLSSAISLYYYLRVVLVVYSKPEATDGGRRADPWGTAAVALAGVLTLGLGIFPAVLYGLAERSSLL